MNLLRFDMLQSPAFPPSHRCNVPWFILAYYYRRNQPGLLCQALTFAPSQLKMQSPPKTWKVASAGSKEAVALNVTSHQKGGKRTHHGNTSVSMRKELIDPYMLLLMITF